MSKPVAHRRFRAVWPLLWQRRRLMPLVELEGMELDARRLNT